MLLLGAANIWWVPLSNWAGRRTVLIVATLVMTLSSVWCALATSYNSLLAARIFQGIGGAAADTVAPAVVGELYPLYERGRAMVCLIRGMFSSKNSDGTNILTLFRPCTRPFFA